MSETQMAGPPATPPPNPLTQLLPQRSAGLKLLLVCALALLMAIPALFVFGVVQDRRMGADRALEQISDSIGGRQSLLGPVLVLPYAKAVGPLTSDRQVFGPVIGLGVSTHHHALEIHLTPQSPAGRPCPPLPLLPPPRARLAKPLHSCFGGDLGPASKGQAKVQYCMLMDVILTQRAVPLEAAAREEELLLIWRDALHEFNRNLYAVNGVRRLSIQWDCPAC